MFYLQRAQPCTHCPPLASRDPAHPRVGDDAPTVYDLLDTYTSLVRESLALSFVEQELRLATVEPEATLPWASDEVSSLTAMRGARSRESREAALDAIWHVED